MRVNIWKVILRSAERLFPGWLVIPRNEIIPLVVVCVVGVLILNLTDQPVFREVHAIPLTLGAILVVGAYGQLGEYFVRAQSRGGAKELGKVAIKAFLIFVVAIVILSLVFPEFR